MTFTVPESIAAARDTCASLEGLAHASGWQRAAIVWAFTEKPANQHCCTESSAALSVREFARLKLPGLCSQDAVRKYHDAWQWAIDNEQAQPANPGATVNIPETPWPPTVSDKKPGTRTGQKKATRTEAARLADLCGSAYQQGYQTTTIAQAAGLSRSAVGGYVSKAGVKLRRGGAAQSWQEPTAPLDPLQWRDSEQRPTVTGPIYSRSRVMALLSHTKRECLNDNALNQLANDMDDALGAGDQGWVDNAREVVGWLHQYLGQLEAVLVSSQARQDAIRHVTSQREGVAKLYALPNRSA